MFRAGIVLFRTFGVRGAAQRALYIARRRAGMYRSSPPTMAPAVLERVRVSPPPAGWPFRPDASAVARATKASLALERAHRVLRGEHQAFRTRWLPRPHSAEGWSIHPHTGYRHPAEVPWFRIATLDPNAGDIKDVWEPGRFGWMYDLVRGWLLTRDARYIEVAWTGLESFLDGCRPMHGVQWACGQETAIRAFAWLWLEGSAADAPASTADRLARLRDALVASAIRIDDALEYALSQRNNHAISEAAALAALGARFRGTHPAADRWLRRGRRTLEEIIPDQIAEDGWYIQHSFTYARVALDQLVLAERALRSAGLGLSDRAAARIRALIALLAEVADSAGHLPNHGANDGAFVLPVTTAAYRDFRPSLTAAAATFGASLPSDLEVDAETLAWLGEHVPTRTPPRSEARVVSGASGWVHAVVPGARVFARAATYHARPGHIDPLHADVWIDGRPVAIDAGTYRYASEPWTTALASVEAHNTLSLPAHPVSRRGPRFLWLGWPAAAVRSAALHGTRARLELEHHSWRTLGVLHRRTIILEPGGVRVDDELATDGTAAHQAVVHWLLDGPADVVQWTGDPMPRASHRNGDARTTEGWVSEHYGERRPATSLLLQATSSGGRLRITTLFGSARVPATHAAATAEMATS